jgi:hypothetical protein
MSEANRIASLARKILEARHVQKSRIDQSNIEEEKFQDITKCQAQPIIRELENQSAELSCAKRASDPSARSNAVVHFVPPSPVKQQSIVQNQHAAIQPSTSKHQTPQQDIIRFGVLADRYLKTPAIRYDHAYGIQPVEGSTNFRLGRMDVKIEGDDFIIDEKIYKGTEGLWKLLTLKDPGDVTSEDFEVYKNMMQQTKPFLLDGQDRVKCNRGKKFKECKTHFR